MDNKKQTIKDEIIQIKEILNELKIDFKYIRSLVDKHDKALYSEDGTNGICRDVDIVKTKLEEHLQTHWKAATILLTIFSLIFSVINWFIKPK
jgi:hypothetical protein